METELGGKIGDRMLGEGGHVLPAPGVLVRHVGIEIPQHLAHAAGELRVLQAHAQLVIGNFAQDGDGIVIEVLPAAGGEFLENLLRPLVPGPPEVVGQTVEVSDEFG